MLHAIDRKTLTNHNFAPWLLRVTLMLFTLCALSTVPIHSWALTLKEAKAQGLIGEKMNGYLGTPGTSASSTVKKIVESVNKKRRNKYKEIAARKGTVSSAVEKIAAEKAHEKTAKGHFIQNTDGQWIRK